MTTVRLRRVLIDDGGHREVDVRATTARRPSRVRLRGTNSRRATWIVEGDLVQRTPESFVDAYLAEVEATALGAAMDVSRLVPEPCGLDAAGLIAAISDPRLDRLGAGMD